MTGIPCTCIVGRQKRRGGDGVIRPQPASFWIQPPGPKKNDTEDVNRQYFEDDRPLHRMTGYAFGSYRLAIDSSPPTGTVHFLILTAQPRIPAGRVHPIPPVLMLIPLPELVEEGLLT